ncbi:hypothetical protein [Tahibacter harae]|uniref:Beta-ketoacyl-[acyl-carrier-protein] synthase III N-terminal domain-containing protein n=1 Tax=Tahibacter harae TaxID=2963937 RepID=A0ABT1QNG8_9GAMM|nr:hypothetical protein [Tahibacter harae]MCQ4163595.1 hypothetical protein [Tahibacter harae]
MADAQVDRAPGWGGIRIELGDRKRAVESIEDAAAQFRAQKLPMNPALLGYGHFHECTEPAEQPICRAIAASLADTGLAAADVDLFIIAAADVDYLAARKLIPELLHQCGLDAALPMTVTSQECTSLLSAIDMARRYVAGGAFRNVLVVCYDKARSEAQRIQSFGVISDAAVACVVSAELPLEFRIRGYAHRSDLAGMRGGDDFASRRALLGKVTGDVLAQGGVALANVRKVFATNFFRPLAKFNAATLGLAEDQLYTDLSPEIGHCLCGDPLINFSGFLAGAAVPAASGLYLLQAYAPGFLASMLVEQAGVPAVRHGSAAAEIVQDW